MDIKTLRADVARATASSYGAMRAYAVALCEILPSEWYLVEAKDTGKTADAVRAEKKLLFVDLKAVEHSNPSTIWARVRKYANEHIHGVPGEGEGEGEGEGGNAQHRRGLKLRMVEELIRLYKAGKREEAPEQSVANALTFVASALAELGVDLANIKD